LRPGQQRLTAELLPRLAIEPGDAEPLDPQRLFLPPPRAVWLEIGFGSGEHLAAQAGAQSDVGLVGCEVFEKGVAKCLAEIARRGLANVRLFTDDARILIAALSPGSIGRVFILFPDPWPKARHHKRRLVSAETLDRLARIMTPGAELRLATDDPGYFAWMLECVSAHPEFEWLARRPTDWRERPADWPSTRYEEKARAAGRKAWFIRAHRIGPPELPAETQS
jgi:tRNA (guanine-N7-)-methyltransferase